MFNKLTGVFTLKLISKIKKTEANVSQISGKIMKNHYLYLSLLGMAMVLVVSAHAETPLFDFEKDEEIAAWRIRTVEQDRLERSSQLATSGQSSMMFTTPAWQEGREQWPAFDAQPPVTDWRPYDRLVFDIINPDFESHYFSLFISDSKVPLRRGLSYYLHLPVRGFKRLVIPLSRFPAEVDRSDIAILHFFTQRPNINMRLYLDNLVLLKLGEELPEPPARFVQQLVGLIHDSFYSLNRLLSEYRSSAEKICKQRANMELGRVAAHLQAVREELNSPTVTLTRVEELQWEMNRFPGEFAAILSRLRFQKAYRELGLPENNMAVGFATSMERILPRAMPFELTVAKNIEVSLARNEEESFQVAVLPVENALRKVSVSVSDLRSTDGNVFKAGHIDSDVVGFVKTSQLPPYPVSHVGWWPDPILNFLGPVDIAVGTLQTFWIRIRAPKDQAPGVYHGTIQVSAEGVEPVEFGLTVQVRSFHMPDHSPLPMAISFCKYDMDQMGGEENWSWMRFVYADFLADYYIGFDNIYRRGPPDFEVLKHLHEQGRLVSFILRNFFNLGADEGDIERMGFDRALAMIIECIRYSYEKAKELGLLEFAYLYGFDERPQEQFELLERTAQALRKAFPGVPLMTTALDHSFGLDSVVKSIDTWIPLTPRFDMKKAAMARAQGRQVWWYICMFPKPPYANWFVESDAIEARLLMGAMTAKFRPDGFLYYSINYWRQNQPIEEGPFTDWNPISYATFHGDGSLFYSGPGGKPVPSIRLENFRDGLEDFAYALILEEIIRRYEERDVLSVQEKQWLDEAKAALPVPDALVKTMSSFSRDPKQLSAWRNRMADSIDRSGMPDTNPWGDHFNIRGFPVR